jgi:hypothetical protein
VAVGATQIWNCNTAAAADTAGGGFDYSQTAGMATDLHCTVGTSSAPVCTSASYNFVSGDVGHWLYIASGTNWYPGWYKIASVASNAATLTASVGTARMALSQSSGPYQGANGSLNANNSTYNGVGCSSTATNTNGATWTIDRSFSTSAFATNGGGNGTVSSSNLTPGSAYTAIKADVGNTVNITGGTGATTGWYTIKSISGSAWVLDRAPGGSGTNITWNMGGAFETIGGVGAAIATTNVGANGQRVYITGNQSLSNTTANTSGGPFSTSDGISFEGYQTVPGDLAAWPYIDPGSQSAVTLFASGASNGNPLTIKNLCFNGKNASTTNGADATSSGVEFEDCMVINFAASSTTYGISGDGASIVRRCYIYNCGIGITATSDVDLSEIDSCTTGINNSLNTSFLAFTKTIVHGCSGVGIQLGSGRSNLVEGVTCYDNTLSGIDCSSAIGTRISNSIVYGNGAYGVKTSSGNGWYDRMLNVASGNNTSGRAQTGTSSPYDPLAGQVLLTADPFENLNGSVTSTNGTNLTVDGSNNLKVTPDGYTPQSGDVGLKLIILPGTGWSQGFYTIASVSGGAWILNASPAATSTASGIWRLSDFRPNNVAGGGALLRAAGQPIPTQAG